MKSLNIIRTLVLMTVLALALAACGSGGTGGTGGTTGGGTTSGGLPLFAGAKVVEEGSPMAMVVNASKDQLKNQPGGADAKIDAYSLPAGTTFDQVKTFYNDELGKQGYKSAESMGAAAGSMPGSGVWIKENSASSVTVTSIPGQAELIIMIMQIGK
jgi:hypothetical protein